MSSLVLLAVVAVLIIVVLMASRSKTSEPFYYPAYDVGEGPAYGKPMGVPIPANTIVDTSESYNRYNPEWWRWYYGGSAYSAGSEPPLMAYSYQYPALSVPPKAPLSSAWPYGVNVYGTPSPPTQGGFFSSVPTYAPLPSVMSTWEKIGLLVSTTSGADPIKLTLYRRPIAPAQDVWEYMSQSEGGTEVLLKEKRYLEDGDIISVTGYGGEFRVHNYAANRYVWV